jgi:hypothetical protein
MITHRKGVTRIMCDDCFALAPEGVRADHPAHFWKPVPGGYSLSLGWQVMPGGFPAGLARPQAPQRVAQGAQVMMHAQPAHRCPACLAKTIGAVSANGAAHA